MVRLPKRPGEYVVYENAHGTRYHVEWTRERHPRMYGLENVTEGMSLLPRTAQGIERFVAGRSLVLVEIGLSDDEDRPENVLNRIERMKW